MLEKPSVSSYSKSPPALSRKSTIVAVTTLIGLALFAVLASYQAFLPKRTVTLPSQKFQTTAAPCGNSSAQAHALGCTFDQLM